MIKNIFQHASGVDTFGGIVGFASPFWSDYLRTCKWLNPRLAEPLAFTDRAFGLCDYFGLIYSQEIGQFDMQFEKNRRDFQFGHVGLAT